MSQQENIKRTNVNTLGEFGLIDHITQNVDLVNPSTRRGIGDDAAVIHNGELHTVISTDMLVEGIHFDLMYTPLKHLGYKAVVVNLSDIYAMNAIPKQITVSIAFSNRFSVEAIDELYEGIQKACKIYNVDLIGGDTTSSPKGLTLSITAIGQAREEDLVYRDGAKVGDILCVTGDLGAAYLGLQLLEREKQVFLEVPTIQPDLEDQEYCIRRFLKPEARREAVEYFHKNNFKPTSMIDVSDGLASELFHICRQSQVGAFIDESKISIQPDAFQLALKFQIDPTTCALNGGEDYELLFTVDPQDLEKVRFMPNVYLIGDIIEAKDGISLHTNAGKIHPLKAQGWVHFSGDKAKDN